jgi:hypothetical protein
MIPVFDGHKAVLLRLFDNPSGYTEIFQTGGG